MEYFVVGQVVRLTHSVYDDTGAPVNATTVSLTINLPDGTAVTPTVTNTGTGEYRVDYQALQAGRYTYVWETTGPTAPDDGSFDVHPLTQAIVSLVDVKAHLNRTGTADDEELRRVIEAATELVEDHPEHGVGAVVVRSHTERHDGGRLLVLHHHPVVAVTSVTPDSGPAYAISDLDVDLTAGLVRRKNRSSLSGPLTVVYTAGRPIIPTNITEAALVVVKWLWESQRGPGMMSRFNEGEPPAAAIGAGWSDLPNRARALLSPNRKGPLVA